MGSTLIELFIQMLSNYGRLPAMALSDWYLDGGDVKLLGVDFHNFLQRCNSV